jgi:transposase
MANVIKYAIGLDIAKDKFDACLAGMDEVQRVSIKSSKAAISNSVKGFKDLLTWAEKHLTQDIPAVFCMEATGIYYESLAWFLFSKGYHVSVLVPNKAKNYIRSLGNKSKDDKADAQGLATMAAQQSLKQWKPISNQIYELRQLTRYYQQLQNTRTMLRNQLQAMVCGRIENDTVADGLKSLINTTEIQLKTISNEIEICLKKDPVLWEKVSNINSIKGLGLLSIATVIAETDGFALFENQAQLVCYSGYDVIKNQSGKRNGKTKISKMGNSHIRRILFMPAFNVVKYDVTNFSNLYQRVYARTLIKMKAYVAVQRKLLIMIYTLWKRNEKYNVEMHPEMGARLLSFRTL